MNKNVGYLCVGMLAFVCVFLFVFLIPPSQEALVTSVPLPQDGKLPYGYYKITDSTMARLPYGYELDPSDKTGKTILPVTQTALLASKTGVTIPATGIPDGYYLLNDKHQMAHLPEGMKPNVVAIDAKGALTYAPGYVPELTFYQKKFRLPAMLGPSPSPSNNDNDGNVVFHYYTPSPASAPSPPVSRLPKGTYLNDDGTTISFLPPGTVANAYPTPGYIDDVQQDVSPTQLNVKYNDIQNNVNTQFHDDPEKLGNNDDDPNNGGAVVWDPRTETWVVLPRLNIQGALFYDDLTSKKYGRGTFVPNYESTVYLSAVTHKSTVAPYTDDGPVASFCDNPSSTFVDTTCQSLDRDVCASTQCCVLVNGNKCTQGSKAGPKASQLVDHDYYYYMGTCYGDRCPPTNEDKDKGK